MLKALAQRPFEKVLVESRGNLLLVSLGDSPEDDSAEAITYQEAQNLMSRGGWEDSVPESTMTRVHSLLPGL
jgi:hypothetical protein